MSTSETLSLIPSIFNDVLGPVMRGPSSSHTAASVRIGHLVRDLCGGTPDRVKFEFDTQGSLATTHEAQGSDMGLFGGLLGWEIDHPDLPTAPQALRDAGCNIEISQSSFGDPHPNTYRVAVERGPQTHHVIALSTGGGMIELIEIDGVTVSLFGDYATTILVVDNDPEAVAAEVQLLADVDHVSVHGTGPWFVVVVGQAELSYAGEVSHVHRLRAVLPVLSRADLVVPFNHAGELPTGKGLAERPLSDWALEYEMARSGVGHDELLEQAELLLGIMRAGVEIGLAGTTYADRILGRQSGRFVELSEAGELLGDGLINRMTAYVTALMEAKSAMEVIVAAPTAGSCATFPGALLATIEEVGAPPEQAQRALLTGGLIGIFVTNRSTFAAELGGCQAETGAGAAMAAAALVELRGGSAATSLSAASQSLQNVLGLVCDPVANRVEAPCLGRNVNGAANALVCANMAIAGYDHLIPLDEVLDAHRQISELMPRELRCTGLAGLAVTPTAVRIELSLTKLRG